MTQTCRHGLTLTEACRECDLANAQETVRRYGDDVDQARRVIVQCDGCQMGAPMSRHGNHHMPDGGFMGCTRDRYVEPEMTRDE
jgi:hypothetical protein